MHIDIEHLLSVMHVRTNSQNCTDEQAWESKAISVCIFTITAWTAILIPAACITAALPSVTVTVTLIGTMTNKDSDSGWSSYLLQLDTRQSP